MLKDADKSYHLILVSILTVISCSLFFYLWQSYSTVSYISETQRLAQETGVVQPTKQKESVDPPITQPVGRYIPEVLSAIKPKITRGDVEVTAISPKVFSYAHGTAMAGEKIFIGMSYKAGDIFPTNQIVAFDSTNISRPVTIVTPAFGDIETMIYDPLNDKIYFLLSANNSLKLFSLDPRTYRIETLISTSSIDVGLKPAIVTDGVYIYGITETDPSKVFRVGVKGDGFTVSSFGHIANGHSAAIGIFGSSTELYFAGGMDNGFEKTDAVSLLPIATTKIEPCSMSDDMPFAKIDSESGYVYIGCEAVAYGVRVKTDDLTFERFSLPGASFGLNIYGNDLYNSAKDGKIDIFPGRDLGKLHRYRVVSDGAPLVDNSGQDLELNEILYNPGSDKIYFTAWWGTKGLFEVSTKVNESSLVANLISGFRDFWNVYNR